MIIHSVTTEDFTKAFMKSLLFPEGAQALAAVGLGPVVPESPDVREAEVNHQMDLLRHFYFTEGHDTIVSVLQQVLPHAIPVLKAFYRDHPDESLASGINLDDEESLNTVIAIVIVVRALLAAWDMGMVELPLRPDWICQNCAFPHFLRGDGDTDAQ